MTRLFFSLFLTLAVVTTQPALAQTGDVPAPATTESSTTPSAADRAATGGAQTLEDILARQRGEAVPDRQRDLSGVEAQAAAMAAQLGVRGSASDSDVWSALRYGTADVTVSTGLARDEVLVQDGGMAWYAFRAGPLREYGGYSMIAMIGVLILFYLLRGRIRIDGGRTGVTILRFNQLERVGHWLLASTFILLGITGLIVLFGRVAFIPLFGHEAFSTMAIASKWIHNWVAWGFIAGLILTAVLWIPHNLPNRHDLVWMLKAGGLFSKGVHPPARKFNAGQKLLFWSVLILGASVSVSGLSLLLPFELPLFAKSFGAANDLGIGPLVNGGAALPATLTPHAEMQLATLWHAIVAFAMMVIIIAHIYLGSVGMEGAFDAMGSGEVDLQWAKEHHGLWVDEEMAKRPPVAPAE